MKKKNITLILLAMFFIGVVVLLYPSVSQYLNSKVQSKAIDNYDKVLDNISEEDFEKYFEDADAYNKKLASLSKPLVEYKKLNDYSNLLNINNDGMMGYISIDKIKVELPIYHTTDESVLNVAAGHFEGTSLPIGGQGTHSVLSAHRGLPTSTLFTDLNKLEIGDTFQITILNRTMTYQIDDIEIVEPEDITKLEIEKNKDYVTLVTCTPYGINTHRLLVRGTRIENPKELKVYVTTEAFKVNKLVVAEVIALPVLLILIMIILFKPAKRKTRNVVNDYIAKRKAEDKKLSGGKKNEKNK